MKLQNRNILITGALGFIGSNFYNLLVEELEVPRENITVVDSLTYASNKKNIKGKLKNFIEAPIQQIHSHKDQFESPHLIVNFAAETHVDNSIKSQEEFVATNIAGVNALLKLARDNSSRFIQISTDEVYGDTAIANDYCFVESDNYNPSNPYSSTKAAADLMIRAYHRTYADFTYNIIRPTNNFGPNQHREKFIPTVIRSALKGNMIPLYGDGMNIREWLFVRKCAAYIAAIVEFGEHNSIYNIGSENNRMHNKEMIYAILDCMRTCSNHDIAEPAKKSKINFVPDRPGHDRRYALNANKFKSLRVSGKLYDIIKAYEHMPFEQQIEETVEYYFNKQNEKSRTHS